MSRIARHVLPLLTWSLAGLAACTGGGLPSGLRRTPAGDGPLVRWDLSHRPLPEIPLPNDVATWPDPSSPTGRRLNPSFVAPTTLEANIREQFGELDGWSTYGALSVGFDAPLDLDALVARQGGERFRASDFQAHAVYLINLRTGVPVPLDVNGGNFHYALEQRGRYYPNDPRADEANLLFESVEEDLDRDGILDPGEDTDFDGVLDHPNTIDGLPGTGPEDTYDHMAWFYERETDTLVLRPIVPLDERTEYAVVLTNRLIGENGSPVRSPFPDVHHIAQTESLAGLPRVFAAHADIYGDLAGDGLEGVAFAWTFTTQSITSDLVALRDGLYGRGPYAFLADQFPPDLVVAPSRGGTNTFPCEPGTNLVSVPWEAFRDTIASLATEAFGLSGEGLDELLATYDQVDHVVVGFYETPFIAGDPDDPAPDAHWRLATLDAAHPPHRDLVPVLITVPRETPEHQQPFPVAFYGHGYTGANLESLGFAGEMAQNGVASVAIDAVGHGLALDRSFRVIVEALFTTSCLTPMGRTLGIDRAVDLDGDLSADSGGDFWSAYVFHTRDVVRQSVLDHIQLIRILRHFEGAPGGPRTTPSYTLHPLSGDPIVASGDLDGDGTADPAGDFDRDGTADIGGWDNAYHAWGQSLGGFIAPILEGVDPSVRTAAPTSGAGGLLDVGIRSQIGEVRDAVVLRTMGPLIVATPNAEGPSDRSACAAGERSVQFIVPSVNDRVDIEFACLTATELAPGDAVVVRNLSNGERRCAGVDDEGRFRVGVPSDAGDAMEVDVFQGGLLSMDYATCEFRTELGATPEASRVIATFESGNGSGEGLCARCARYQDHVWEVDEFLESPTEGFGLRRQSPEYRRFMALAQTAVDPGDPINYVGNVFLHPITAEDVSYRGPRSLLVASAIGDQDVPLSAGNAMARAAGILAFIPPGGPDELADWRAPVAFSRIHPGYLTPNALLNGFHVLEGVPRFARHPVVGNQTFLADVDDLGDGRQLYTASGDPAGASDPPGMVAPVRSDPPLRWTRASRSSADGAEPFDPVEGSYAGISGVLNVYVSPSGNHGTEVPEPLKSWDEGLYFPRLVGHFFATDGRELLYHNDPAGHGCLEDYSCSFFAGR